MKQRIVGRVLTLVIIFLLASVTGNAREVEATVSLNVDRLPTSLQEEVSGFDDALKQYIDNTVWTDFEWEGEKVKVNINVVFTGGSANGYYTAQLLVGSQRNIYKSESLSPMMKVLDDSWTFAFVRNQPIQQDPVGYDNLSGLIDFYVYIAIGLDLDSYGYLGGNPIFEKARTIAHGAEAKGEDGWSAADAPGAYTRYNFIRELTDVRYNPIRKFLYNYHYNGLDLRAQNPDAALDSINTYLSDLVRFKDNLVQSSTLIRVLNDTKYVEYAELFAGYHDPKVWRKLIYIDPSHQATYQEAQDR